MHPSLLSLHLCSVLLSWSTCIPHLTHYCFPMVRCLAKILVQPLLSFGCPLSCTSARSFTMAAPPNPRQRSPCPLASGAGWSRLPLRLPTVLRPSAGVLGIFPGRSFTLYPAVIRTHLALPSESPSPRLHPQEYLGSAQCTVIAVLGLAVESC